MEGPGPPVPLEQLLAHREWVREVARALVRDENQADDLEQDVWLEAIRRPPRSDRSIRGWFAAALRHDLVDRRRAEERRRGREEARSRPAPPTTPEELVAQAEAHKRVVNVVMDLPEPYRSTVLFRYFESLDSPAIALRMGVPAETVRTRLARALGMLRERFDGEHRGDRKAWCLVLLPLVGPREALATAGGAAAAVTGGLLMSKSATAAAVAVLLAVGAWLAFRTGGGDGGQGVLPPPVESASAPAMPEQGPAGTAPLPPPPAGVGVILGRLVRGWPLRPVPGTFTVSGAVPDQWVAADGAGLVRIEGLPRGTVLTALAESAGLIPVRLPGLRIPENGLLDLGDLILGAGQRLEFVVMDTAGRPLQGAEVALHRASGAMTGTGDLRGRPWNLPPSARAVADAEGRLAFESLAPSMYFAVAGAKGFARRTLDVYAQEGIARGPVRMVLRPGSTLGGTVRGADGRPRPGVAVISRFSYAPAQAPFADYDFAASTTDAEGRYLLEGLMAGWQELEVDLPSGPRLAAGTVEVPGVIVFDIRIPGGASVRGRVLDDATSAPVAGASVRLSVKSGTAVADIETGADGTFAVEDLPPGILDPIAVHRRGYLSLPDPPSYPPTERPIVLASGSSSDVEIRLKTGAVVRGHVLTSAGAPVAGAKVEFFSPMRRIPAGRSGADGGFRLECLPAGRGMIRAAADEGYPRDFPTNWYQALQDGTAPAAWTVDVPPVGEVVKDLVLFSNGSVEGVVVDGEGNPVPGTMVGIGRSDFSTADGLIGAATDEGGRFRLPSVRPGDGLVAAAYGPRRAAGKSAPFRLEEGGVVRDLRVPVSATPGGATLAGVVRRADGGDLSGALLWRVSGRNPAGTPPAWRLGMIGVLHPVGPGGTFRMEEVAAGTTTLFATAEGCATGASAVLEVAAGETREGIEIVLKPGKVLAGQARDGAGHPIAGCGIEVWRATGGRDRSVTRRTPIPGATTDPEGRFEFRGLDDADYEVTAGAPGRMSDARTVKAGTTDLVLVLDDCLSLSGTVVDEATGAPVAGVGIEVRAVAPRPGMAQPPLVLSGRDGSFSVGGLATGSHTVTVDPLGTDLAAPEALTVEAGAADVRLSLPPGLAIEGRVVDGDGRPLGSGFVLRLIPQGPDGKPSLGWGRLLFTGAAGTFRAGGLEAGLFELRYEADSSGVYPRSVESAFLPAEVKGIAAGTRDLEVRLVRGLPISGRVVDEGGASIVSGAWISVLLLPGDRRNVSTTAGPDGVFQTPSLEPGKAYDLSVSAPGAMRATVKGVLAGTKDVVVTLSRGKSISGRVVDEDGKPAPAGISVSAYAMDAKPDGAGLSSSTATVADGSFTVEGLGDYRFQLYAGGAVFSWAKPVEAAAGATDVVVPWARGRSFAGRLLDGAGRPCAGRQVWLEFPVPGLAKPWRTPGTADFDGRFSFDNLSAGPVVLFARTDAGEVECGSFQVPCEPVEVTVRDR
jgi:RNA polymerase sigma factor (sigma-70 family)